MSTSHSSRHRPQRAGHLFHRTLIAGAAGSILLGPAIARAQVESGACCLPDCSCVEVADDAACEALGGSFGGAGSTCETVMCVPEVADTCADWAEVNEGPPLVLYLHAMASDGNGTFIAHGGYYFAGLSGTFVNNGDGWVSVAAGAPSTYGCAMDYGPNGLVWLYGGRDTDGDTYGLYSWDSGTMTWTAHAAPLPPGRVGHAMAFDPTRGPTGVLHVYGGGASGPTNTMGDYWVFDGSAWTQLIGATTNPPPLYDAAMAVDRVTGHVYLFGGQDNYVYSAQTWRWDGTDWTLIANGSPPARAGHRMVWDPTRQAIIMTGGESGNGAQHYNDIWELRDGAWTRLCESAPFPARANFAMAQGMFNGEQTILIDGGLPVSTTEKTWKLSSAGCRAVVAAKLVINEVLYFEDDGLRGADGDHEWVEIYNATGIGIDLTGWTIADRDGWTGAGARALPSITLPAEAYLVVHFGQGVDDLNFDDLCGEYYTQDAQGADVLDDIMDECALYDDDGAIHDFVAWRADDTGYVAGVAAGDAVAAGGWTDDEYLNTRRLSFEPGDRVSFVEIGTTIGRDADSTDSNGLADWATRGGVNALGATPCAANFAIGGLLPGALPPGPMPMKQWTVLYYIDADAQDLEKDLFQDLEEVEEGGGSSEDINVVAMIDGFKMIHQVTIGPGGALTPIRETGGKSWRFQIGADEDGADVTRYVRMLTPDGQNPYLDESEMGRPETLSDFIAWAKANFPAQRYALIVSGHGRGWKGLCFDDSSPPDSSVDDGLMIGELRQALGNEQFELIGFDCCHMAQIEVAHQVQPNCRYLVGSEEVELGSGWPQDRWIAELRNNPGWNGAQLGGQIVADFSAYYSELVRDPTGMMVMRDPKHTLSCIDQSRIPELVDAVSDFAEDLRIGCDDFVLHSTHEDNIQHRIKLAAQATARFMMNDFMDLRHFVEEVNTRIPSDCYKDEVPTLLSLLQVAGPVVLNSLSGPEHPNAHGLSVYMPLTRTEFEEDALDVLRPVEGTYDYPHHETRVSDENSRLTMYAENADQLPFAARDYETTPEGHPIPLPAPSTWPLTPAPDFRFPADTQWDEFLQRYYHPVADNEIVGAICPIGGGIGPLVVDPECNTPIDEIVICPGCTVFFSGASSSDADSSDSFPDHWFWDFDANSHGCGPCVAPYEVADGADPALAANDDMDADRNRETGPPQTNDEKQDTGGIVTRTFHDLGTYVVTLHVWDDNHTFPFHNALPNSAYVHPQSDTHISIVHVVPCPDSVEIIGVFPDPVPTDTEATVTARVLYQGEPIRGYEVQFVRDTGDFEFTSGRVTSDGEASYAHTDENGYAQVTINGNSNGVAWIFILVGGTILSDFIQFDIVEPPVNCPCDWNDDGILNSDDFFAFFQDFINGGDADFNGDGITNSDDFFAFLQCYLFPPPDCR